MTTFPASAGLIVDERGSAALIEIDSDLYSEDVALRAAYWLTDRCHIHIRRSDERKFVAEVRRKDGKDGDALAEVCGEFCNGLIDFAIRERILTETRSIHEALTQRAFSELIPNLLSAG